MNQEQVKELHNQVAGKFFEVFSQDEEGLQTQFTALVKSVSFTDQHFVELRYIYLVTGEEYCWEYHLDEFRLIEDGFIIDHGCQNDSLSVFRTVEPKIEFFDTLTPTAREGGPIEDVPVTLVYDLGNGQKFKVHRYSDPWTFALALTDFKTQNPEDLEELLNLIHSGVCLDTFTRSPNVVPSNDGEGWDF